MADAYGSRGGETGLCNKCKGIATAKLPINPPTQKKFELYIRFYENTFFPFNNNTFFSLFFCIFLVYQAIEQKR